MAFLLAWVFTTEVWAAAPRCGTDDFGNAVCIDRDGVVTAVSQSGQTADGVDGKAGGVDGKAGGESGSQGARDAVSRPRCKLDPFGNKVCR
jgi:hypothetical protein